MYEVYLDGKLLYYPGDEVNIVTSAVLKTKLNDSGTFDITIPRKNPLYEKYELRVSELLIKKNGEEIWNGEIRGSKGNLKKENVVHAVGELSYLGASSQPQKKYTNVNPLQMMTSLVNIHNSQVEPRKQFTVGVVTVGNYNYDWITNYENTLDFMRKEMCDKLKGYLRIRRENGVRYIDLVSLEHYGKSCEQPIKFGKNLLDYATGINSDAIVTVVRPLGAALGNGNIEGIDSYLTIEAVNNGKDYLENTEAIQSGMGYIWKTVHFNVLTTPEDVKTAGENWLKDNQFQNMTIDVTAIDLSEINSNIESFDLGDSARIIAKPFGLDRWSYVTEKKLDLLNPATKHNISIGDNVKKTYTQQVTDEKNSLRKEIPQQSTVLQLAKKNASELIKNAAEGNISIIYDDTGKPKELLIMDTQDINSAKKVWRWNINGLGYSSTGYNGEYALAMTMDGAIVADFITTGILNAALIKAGVLSDKAGKNYFNLETGEFKISASAKVGESTVASTKNVADAKQEAENYANDAAGKAANQAEVNAKADTNEKLKSYMTIEQMHSAISQTAEGIRSEASATYATQTSMLEKVNNLQQQIDGAIETFSGSNVPTLSNYPVNNWKDNDTKDAHIGDLYIVNADGGDKAGFYYRFEKTSSGYQWTLLKDNEVTKALQDAKEASEKAQAVADDLNENYSTTVEMNSAIEQSSDAITSSVSKQITETKTYADNAAKEAETNANNETDKKLKSYSTTTEMNSAITQTAQAIDLEVKKKVGNDEVISKINQTAEEIVISAKKIDVDGVLDVEKINALDIIAKNLNANKGIIAGWDITAGEICKEIDLYPNMTEGGLAGVGDNDPVQYVVWLRAPTAANTASFYIGYRYKSYYLSGGRNWYTLFAARPNGEVMANNFKSNNAEITGGRIKISGISENSDPIIELGGSVSRKMILNPYEIMFFGNEARSYAQVSGGMIECGELLNTNPLTRAPKAYLNSDGSIVSLYAHNTVVSNSPNAVIDNGIFKRSSSSSRRYKTDITEAISEELDPKKLYEVPVKMFKYKEGYLSEGDSKIGKDIIGFIVEDLEEKYASAVQYNGSGEAEMWNSNIMIPAMLKLIQEQNQRILTLEERLGITNG